MKNIHFILSILCYMISMASFCQEAQQTITIPVIFHVVYQNKEENIERNLILKEMNDLQNDFLLQNRDVVNAESIYKDIIGNPRIKFVLASDHSSQGIIYVTKKKKGRLHKSSPVISPQKYLNVYIGNIYNVFRTVGVVYSSTPWNQPESDGIYLHYENIGKGQRLLTHEAGHWLGLLHTFQDRRRCKAAYDDGILDTPWQKKASGNNGLCYDREPYSNSCDPLLPAMYNNFMDYSNCRCLFTKEQCKRMRLNLEEHRSEMFKASF